MFTDAIGGGSIDMIDLSLINGVMLRNVILISRNVESCGLRRARTLSRSFEIPRRGTCTYKGWYVETFLSQVNLENYFQLCFMKHRSIHIHV